MAGGWMGRAETRMGGAWLLPQTESTTTAPLTEHRDNRQRKCNRLKTAGVRQAREHQMQSAPHVGLTTPFGCSKCLLLITILPEAAVLRGLDWSSCYLLLL